MMAMMMLWAMALLVVAGLMVATVMAVTEKPKTEKPERRKDAQGFPVVENPFPKTDDEKKDAKPKTMERMG